MAGRSLTILVAVEPPLLGELLQRLLSRADACAAATTVVTVWTRPVVPPTAAFDVLITTPGVTVNANASRRIQLRVPPADAAGVRANTLDPDSLTDLLRQLDELASATLGSVTS